MRYTILVLALILTSCVVTPTPEPITATPPQSPPITPTRPPSPPITPTPPVSPIGMPPHSLIPPQVQVISTTLQNGNFEGPFTVRGNAVTVAQFWNPWQLNAPPCRPGATGCDIPCPSNCGSCGSKDQGCFWAMPEFAAAYKPDYNPPRSHSGNWAQKFFVFGREGEGGLYQQVQVSARSLLTFTAWFESWQCFDSDHCSLRAVAGGGSPSDPPPDPERALFLMGEWGCTDKQICNNWTASDRPYAMHMRVGIDPTGGISPTASTVIWGKEIESFDYWSRAIVTATTRGGMVTVFTSGSPTFDFARLNNDVYIDDAALQIQPLPPQIQKMYLPIVRRK